MTARGAKAQETFQEYASFASTLADAAGDVLRRYFRTALTTERKADESPVTLADRNCEAVIRSLIEQHYPEHGIFGEEHGRSKQDAALQWVIDPIDGTRAFLAGYPTFTTLIALCENGAAQLGVIEQPYLRERWEAVSGGKTRLNGKPVSVRSCDALSKVAIATTSMAYFTPEQREKFRALKEQCAAVATGGDAYAYAMLASGQLDMVVDAGMKPYDYMALVNVVEGAGGVITDWNGQPLRITSDGTVIAAVNAELHKQALKLLKA